VAQRQVRKVQRVAAYAVILRDDQVLLSRLASRLTSKELWTLPGGGLEHGEDPRDAVVREVHEETGLDVEIGETAHVYSFHQRNTWRQGRRADAHALRIVYDGWVAVDAPEPRVVEVDGSTAEAAWKPLAEVLDGTVPTVALVTEVLREHRPYRMQRVAAYALVLRGEGTDQEVLLTRLSPRAVHTGRWALPGGGIGHGEEPRAALVREFQEECGVRCEVGEVIEVDAAHFEGTAPSGRHEDFHAVRVVFAAALVDDAEPRVAEQDGTTDAVAWVPLRDVEDGSVPVLDVVTTALEARRRRSHLVPER
jgi:ADP-ribose pyrophosphatase YjhB (NUDIX family)